MSAQVKPCPWCGTEISRGKLCLNCENQATSLGRVSDEEFDRLPYGAIKINAEGIITRVNRAELSLSGLGTKDYVGENFFEIAPCTQVRAFSGRFQRFLSSARRTHEFNFVYRIRGRGAFGVRITLVRLSDGALILASQQHVVRKL